MNFVIDLAEPSDPVGQNGELALNNAAPTMYGVDAVYTLEQHIIKELLERSFSEDPATDGEVTATPTNSTVCVPSTGQPSGRLAPINITTEWPTLILEL